MVGPVDHVSLQACLTPSRPAASDLVSGRHWTFAELNDDVARFAGALVRRKVGRGVRVAALAKNRMELILLHLACARLGAIYVPLNWRLAPGELRAICEDCSPTLVLGDDCLSQASLRGEEIAEFAAESYAAAPNPPRRIDLKAPSLILYTSGTSGKAKGVLLSEDNLAHNASNFSVLGEVTRESVFLCDAPMFHTIGLVASVRPAFLRGAKIVVSGGFEPRRTFARLADLELGITHYFCVPQMAAALRGLAEFDAQKLRRLTAIFTGGAPQAAADIRAWAADGVSLVHGYGMTEAGTVFGMPVDKRCVADRAGSVGVAMPNVETRIVDTRGRGCRPGDPGELQLRGPSLTRGYWKQPDATHAAFAPGGWFRTGDIARADQDGFHWIVDRQKDMYISGGENVYPAEIEAALSGHPAIAECAVVGIPDDKWGEVGCAFVVIARNVSLEQEAVLSHLGDAIARYKVPKRVRFVDALPRNAGGKVLKTRLREWAEDDRSGLR